MSFRIEYLTETTEEESVCHAFMSTASTLQGAEDDAVDHADAAKAKGARGFQIRHLNAVDEVVTIADFNDLDLLNQALL
jgi:hypothetical protein